MPLICAMAPTALESPVASAKSYTQRIRSLSPVTTNAKRCACTRSAESEREDTQTEGCIDTHIYVSATHSKCLIDGALSRARPHAKVRQSSVSRRYPAPRLVNCDTQSPQHIFATRYGALTDSQADRNFDVRHGMVGSMTNVRWRQPVRQRITVTRVHNRKEIAMIVELGRVVEETKYQGGFMFDETGPSSLRF